MTTNESFQSEWTDSAVSSSHSQNDELFYHNNTDTNCASSHSASNDDEYKSDHSLYKSTELPSVEDYLQAEQSSVENMILEEDSVSISIYDTYLKSDNLSDDYLLDESATTRDNQAGTDATCQKPQPQIPERVFMNGLIKHTTIALVIIVPLAVLSAYAAPTTVPDEKVNSTFSVLPVTPNDIIYKSTTTPTTVDKVDLAKYSGKWYEIGRMPLFFQRNCARDVTATYAGKTDSSDISVVNECIAADGEVIRSEGLAMPVDATGSQLKVTFLPSWIRWLPIGRGDYWVLARDNQYQTALVGTPDKSNLWLLARTPDISQQTYSKYRQIAQQQGYDLKEFTLTPQTNQSVNLVP